MAMNGMIKTSTYNRENVARTICIVSSIERELVEMKVRRKTPTTKAKIKKANEGVEIG
jgi:hypothetical protein